MMTKGKQFNVKLRIPKTGKWIKFSGEFPSEEWQQLLRFKEYADELAAASVIQNGISSNLRWRLHKESGFSDESTSPSDLQLSAFLHSLRPFVLQREPTFAPKIFNILKQRMEHPQFRAILDRHLRLFNGRESQSQFEIFANDVVLNRDELLYDWLNAYQYHRDDKKRAKLAPLLEAAPIDIPNIFVMMMIDKAKAVGWLSAIIAEVEQGSGVPFTVIAPSAGEAS